MLQVAFGQAASVVSLSNGVQLRVGIRGTGTSLKTRMEPASGNSFYRIFKDENNLDVFAYEIVVERTADGERFHIIAKPAGEEFSSRFPNSDGGKPVPTLSAPIDSEFLTSGRRFDVVIPTDPATREDLTDSIQVTINRRGPPAADSGVSAAVLRLEAQEELLPECLCCRQRPSSPARPLNPTCFYCWKI